MPEASYHIEFQGTLEKFDSKLWGLYVQVPEVHAETILATDNKRLVCTFDQHVTIHCALMPSGKGWWFILINQQIASKIKKEPGETIQVKMRPDSSEFGMDFPEEFSVMLEQDQEAKQYFELLTPGKQRNLIYIVGKVKNTDSRIKKALAICSHLKEVRGKLDFKRLNETIKWYNKSM